jgi:mono/diheme cytochrome c family protein
MQNMRLRVSLALALALTATTAFAQPSSPQPQGGDAPGGVSKAAPPKSGEQVYRQVCQACHMADAKGGVGAATIPALASDPRLAVPAYPIIMVVKGRGAMPGLTDLLAPTQIAEVVGYIRTHFGNNYTTPVTAADVARATGAH